MKTSLLAIDFRFLCRICGFFPHPDSRLVLCGNGPRRGLLLYGGLLGGILVLVKVLPGDIQPLQARRAGRQQRHTERAGA